jgi:hydrogenase expression/formation protein HypC
MAVSCLKRRNNMCIGIPMEIIEVDGLVANCRNDEEGRYEKVDLSLIGEQEVGSWIIVFMGSGREYIEPENLEQVLQSRKAMKAALEGENVDEFFADLVNREPQLPDFLK